MGKDNSYVEKQGLEAQLKEMESKREAQLKEMESKRKRIVDQLDAVNKRIAKKEEFQRAANDLSGVRGTDLVKGINNLILDSEK